MSSTRTTMRRYTCYGTLHPIRRGAMPTDRVQRTRTQDKMRTPQSQAAADAGSTDTTASQISHVIYRGHFSRQPKNVAIPPMQIRCLNESLRNCVRNCWLVAIAGHQGDAPRPRRLTCRGSAGWSPGEWGRGFDCRRSCSRPGPGICRSCRRRSQRERPHRRCTA